MPFAGNLLEDLRHGLRLLARRPGFSLAAGLSLALGIGATTAIFTVVNYVALRPLPYQDGERLVWMSQILKSSSTDEITITPDFLDWRRLNHSFTDLAAYYSRTRTLTGLGDAAEVQVARASASLLPILGVQPMLGRNFLASEDAKGHDQAALISHDLWQQRFGAARSAVGRWITLDDMPYQVVGVLPPGFVFPGVEPIQVVTPLAKDEQAESARGVSVSIVRDVVGRLRPGMTREQAYAELTVIQSQLPNFLTFHPTISIHVIPLREHLFGNAKTATLVLLAGAGFLLLIACANVSNLLLTSLAARDRELAIRAVLGGSRLRLVTQLLTENAVLGISACVAGTLLAWWIRRPLIALSPYRLAGFETLPFDGRVLAFAMAAGLLTLLLFGLMPAFRATEIRLAEAVKAGAAGVVGGRGSLRMLSLIATAEMAVLLVLSTGAGLLLESFWKLRYGPAGVATDHLTAATLHVSGERYRDGARNVAFIGELQARAQSIPGVEAAAVTNAEELPPGGGHATNVFRVEGQAVPAAGHRPIARFQQVSPEYLPLFRIPLVEGRTFQSSDAAGTQHVAVVNRALASRYFKGESAIGQRIRFGNAGDPWRTIVGIVGDVKTSGLATAPEPAVYYPYAQAEGLGELGLVVRSPLASSTIAAELRRVLAAVDPNLPLATVQTIDDRMGASVSKPRFTALLLSLFAALAVVLGIIGVYAVVACRVRWQVRELAVRQALGAQPRDVIRLVLRQGLAIIVPGIAVGLLGSLALGRSLASLLYQVQPNDPGIFTGAAAGLAVTAVAACWIPARRAARLDPLESLRQE